MSNIYKRYNDLYDRHDDLKEVISEIKHLLTLGVIAGDADERSLYEDKLEEYERDLERTGAELDELSTRIEAIERADFERMTA